MRKVEITSQDVVSSLKKTSLLSPSGIIGSIINNHSSNEGARLFALIFSRVLLRVYGLYSRSFWIICVKALERLYPHILAEKSGNPDSCVVSEKIYKGSFENECLALLKAVNALESEKSLIIQDILWDSSVGKPAAQITTGKIVKPEKLRIPLINRKRPDLIKSELITSVSKTIPSVAIENTQNSTFHIHNQAQSLFTSLLSSSLFSFDSSEIASRLSEEFQGSKTVLFDKKLLVMGIIDLYRATLSSKSVLKLVRANFGHGPVYLFCYDQIELIALAIESERERCGRIATRVVQTASKDQLSEAFEDDEEVSLKEAVQKMKDCVSCLKSPNLNFYH